MTTKLGVPLTKATNHPVLIGLKLNPAMARWDITIDVGNYTTEQEAREAAKGIKEVLEEHLDMRMRDTSRAELEIKDN